VRRGIRALRRAGFFFSDVGFWALARIAGIDTIGLVFKREIRMFKLIRLAIYALVGYAAYQFVMDVINAEPQQSGGGGGPARDRSGRFTSQRRGGGGDQERGTPAIRGARMTASQIGGGEGQPEMTQNSDGGSVSHRVGRGVVG
jgi:hypothetical protein